MGKSPRRPANIFSILLRGRRKVRGIDELGIHFICPWQAPCLPPIVAPMIKPVNIIPFGKLAIVFLTIGILKKGKFRPFKPIFYIKGIFESRTYQFFCCHCTPRPVTIKDEEIICLPEDFVDLFQKGLVFDQLVARLFTLLIKLVGEKHEGKIVGFERMPHKLVFGSGSNVDQIAVRNRVEHVKGFDASDPLDLLSSCGPKKTSQHHSLGKDNNSNASSYHIASLRGEIQNLPFPRKRLLLKT
jgi:hypothetical protein